MKRSSDGPTVLPGPIECLATPCGYCNGVNGQHTLRRCPGIPRDNPVLRDTQEAKSVCARPSCPHPNGGRIPLERLNGREGLLRDPYCCGDCIRRHLDEQRESISPAAGDLVTLRVRVEEVYAEGKALRVSVPGFGNITVPASTVRP